MYSQFRDGTLGCATSLPAAKSLVRLDDKNSVVFGKVELWDNGQPMKELFETFLDPEPAVINHVSRYVSDTSLNKNPWKPGEYVFKVPVFKNGYFSFVIPPGKYYFVEFDYFDLFVAKPLLGLRTYM